MSTSVDAETYLSEALHRSPLVGAVFRKWPRIALPDVWLGAGAVAQTVWNDLFGYDSRHGIDDVDLVHFDQDDLSEETESRHAHRVATVFGSLGHPIDVKNEARVHQWHEAKFGRAIQPYTSTRDAISSFPTTATAIGICPTGDTFEICAPLGLADLVSGVVPWETLTS